MTLSSTSLQSLLKRGFSPTLNSINQFLTHLSHSHRHTLIVNFFFTQLTSYRIEPNSRTHSIVAWALLKLRDYDEAERFMRTHLAETTTPDFNATRLWEALVRGHCTDSNDPGKALVVLRDFLKKSLGISSSPLFCLLIRGFSSNGDMGKAIEVLELMNEFEYPFDNYVCSSVMAGFCGTGQAEFAVRLFESAVVSGALRPNVVTYSALVGGLCKLGKVSEVRELVCRMKKEGIEPDIVFYSTWICGYLSERSLSEVFKRYEEIVGQNISIDTIISYNIHIDRFSKLGGEVEKSLGFPEKMGREVLELDTITFASIVSGFCRRGKVKEAFLVFEAIGDLGIDADEFMYATLIDGLCRVGDFDRVFHTLDDMERRGIKPSLVTYNTVINGLSKLKRTTEADEISKAIYGDTITYGTLLHGYIEEENFGGILETKRRLEESGVCIDVATSNVLLKALFMVGEIDEAREIYEGMVPDSVTFCTMIRGYCRVGRVNEAVEVFDEFRLSGISSVASYNCLVTGLCDNGLVDLAVEVFIELVEKDSPLDERICIVLIKSIIEQNGPESVSNLLHRFDDSRPDVYNTLCSSSIALLCKRSHPEAAFQVAVTMRTKGLTLTSESYYLIIKALISGGYKWPSWTLLTCFLKDYGLDEPRVTKILAFYMCLNDADIGLLFLNKMKGSFRNIKLSRDLFKELMKSGRVLDAHRLITKGEDKNLPKMDVIDYTTVIHCLCKRGRITEALDLADVAQEKGINLDIVTYTSVITGLCSQGRLLEAFRVFDSLERLDLAPSEVTFAVLISALCREGFVSDAERLFERMVSRGLGPNIRVYNSLVDAHCRAGQLEEALELVNDSEAKGLEPDGFTVSALIDGCCYSGDMERALGLFSEFKKRSILPDFMGFLYLARGLCSKGRMEESRSVLREMLQFPSIVELINRVDTEGESESLESFVSSLCDQGSVKEAVSVLNEVASVFHPPRMSSSYLYDPRGKSKTFGSEAVKGCEDSVKNESGFRDFENYYSRVALLCSRGEIDRASRLAKELLSDLD